MDRYFIGIGPYEVKRLRGTDCNGKRMYTTVEVVRKGTDRDMALVRPIGGQPRPVSPTRLEDL